jgi:hypothetical protein
MLFETKRAKIIAAVLILTMMWSMISPTLAQAPYISYGYDWWLETYPVQSGYVVDRVVTGNELIIYDDEGNPSPLRLAAPRDIAVYQDDDTGQVMIFIVDTGNHRIIVTDRNFANVRIMDEFVYCDTYQVKNFLREEVNDEENPGRNVTREQIEAEYWAEVDKIGTSTTLNNPRGIHVTKGPDGNVRVYIADHDNERVLASDVSGNIWMEYRRPVTETYPDEASFRPSKVLTDNAGNVYICIETITQGAVKYNERGNFLGFYGANRVTRTADAILNYFLRFILSREAMERRTRPVPVEFSNFTIDKDQFIYTVTASRTASLDVVTKLDPAGRNVFAQQGYDSMIWGDFNQPFAYGRTYSSMIIDISVDNNGDIYLFDRESCKIFQYDKEGHLMFIFGGRGEQKGLFTHPTAVETFDGRVYALDSVKNSITVFELTEFGDLVIEAMGLFNRGLYADSIEPWEEVLRRDANYYMAYVGMGNAMLSTDRFAEALDYFYMHSLAGYGRAFKDFRINYIRDNFDKFLAIAMIGIGVLIAGDALLKVVKNRKKPVY